MRLISLGLVLAALCGAGVPAACSSFTSTPANGDDGGIAEAGGAPVDGAPALDAATGAILTLAKEKARTAFIAVDTQSIYWWSLEAHEIRKVDKADPGTVKTVVARARQMVTGLAVDSSGVYWLEAGPDEFDGGTSNRIMRLARDATSKALPVYTQAEGMERIVLDSSRVLSTTSNGVVGAKKTGEIVDLSFLLDHEGFGSDGTNAFYTWYGNVYRIDPSGGTSVVIHELVNPTELTFESPTMYGIVQSDAGSALFRADEAMSEQMASAATPIADLPSGTTFLALDNLGVVVANAVDGTIVRVARMTGARTPVVSELMSPNGVAADPQGVYWTTDSGEVGWATR